MPEEGALAAVMMDNVKVEKLIKEFLGAQSLKILPRTHFGAAVTEFVDKDDKRAMQTFVDESLATQVMEMLSMGDFDVDIDTTMDEIRTKQEELWAAGLIKNAKKAEKLAPRPKNWDSDDMGHSWAEDPASRVFGLDALEAGAPKRGRGVAGLFSDDDDASVISQPTKKAPAKKAPAKKVPPRPPAPTKAKAPTKAPARGRKKAVEISDDEEDDDVIMQDDPPPPAKTQPRRAAAAKGQQSIRGFAQSQAKTQASVELSDDEISEDDAFEPVASSSRRR